MRPRDAPAAAYPNALVNQPARVPAAVNLANIHYGRDQLIEAQALYERAINLDPSCLEAHFNAGNIQHDLGRYDRALLYYRAAVALHPAYAHPPLYPPVTLQTTAPPPATNPP